MENVTKKQPIWSLMFAWLIHLSVVFLLVGDPAPGINESHYLVKAKHAWNEEYAPGDIFLESANTHGLFGFVAGFMASYLPLESVAWLGRFLCWSAMAAAWMLFARSLAIPQVLSPCMLAGWHLAVTWGNWAGEWAIGGFEAKSMAYPFVIAALAQCIARRWSAAWILLGISTSLHCLAGGWAAISISLVWFVWHRKLGPGDRQLPAILIALGISLIGILPAAAGLVGPATHGPAQIHTFMRLAHHLSPQLFATDRHVAGAVTLGMLVLVTILHRKLSPAPRDIVRTKTSAAPARAIQEAASSDTAQMMLQFAWVTVAIALAGVCIDFGIGFINPVVSAGLLRFYWFRWFDVVLPLTWVATLWILAVHGSASHGKNVAGRGWLAKAGLSSLVTATIVLGAWFYIDRLSDPIPPADRRLFVAQPSLDNQQRLELYHEWIAVCEWIDRNTPKDSLWLTPRYQQTFKWYAGRAEVYSWKDVPQDNRSVLEWFARSRTCAQPRTQDGRLRDWTTEELKELSRRYGCKWLLIDRRFQKAPPKLRLAYPTLRVEDGQTGVHVLKNTFTVFYIDEAFDLDRNPAGVTL